MGGGELAGLITSFHPESCLCVNIGGGVRGSPVWLSPFPFDYGPSLTAQLDAHRPSHQPAAGLVSQSGTCVITNSWKSKTDCWEDGVEGGSVVCGGDGEGKGQKEAAKERRKEKEGA